MYCWESGILFKKKWYGQKSLELGNERLDPWVSVAKDKELRLSCAKADTTTCLTGTEGMDR